jgi:hypothetical protein
MKIILHQFKQEFLAHRWALVLWLILLALQLTCVLTGFWGTFFQSNGAGVDLGLFRLVEVAIGICVVTMTASFAMTDPPMNQCAHWRALPISSSDLLLSKLIAILVFMVLPLFVVRLICLWWIEASQWSGAGIMEWMSYYPAWLLLGFGAGAVAGNWKRFSITTVMFLPGLILLSITLTSMTGGGARGGYTPFIYNLQRGLSQCIENNVFLPGACSVILLRYFTRVSGLMIALVFGIVVPLCAWQFPVQTIFSYVPQSKTEAMIQDKTIEVEYAFPENHWSVESGDKIHLSGNSPFAGCRLDGLNQDFLLIPEYVRAELLGVFKGNPGVTNRFGSSWSYPSERDFFVLGNDPAVGSSYSLAERYFVYPKLEPNYDMLNPPINQESGFHFWYLDQAIIQKLDPQKTSLQTKWTVKPYRIETLGDLELDHGSFLAKNGMTIRLVAWLADLEDSTQIKLHTMGPIFPTGSDDHDPRWGMGNLRFMLVNEDVKQVCAPSIIPACSGMQTVCNVGYRSVVLTFSMPDTELKTNPLPADWLANAKLRVFRIIPGASTHLDDIIQEVNIVDLPVIPRPDPTDVDYR